MALAVHVPNFTGTGPAASLAAPTTSEIVNVSSGPAWLLAVIGGTATTISYTPASLDAYGRVAASVSTGSVTNSTRVILIPVSAGDVNGNVTVAISQVTAVTTVVLRGL